MAYGVGAALTLDEFALWLNLRDVYWEREGRESFEAMALFAAVLAIGIFGHPFFRGVARELPPSYGGNASEFGSIIKDAAIRNTLFMGSSGLFR